MLQINNGKEKVSISLNFKSTRVDNKIESIKVGGRERSKRFIAEM